MRMSLNTYIYRIGNSLYVNLTNRCSLACTFCPKQSDEYTLHEYNLAMDKHPQADRIITELEQAGDYDELVFCGYGESTFRLTQMLAVAHYAKTKGKRVRLNTDGLGNLIHKRNILPELAENIDALSISLNAQNKHIYNYHCQPSLPGSYEAMREFVQQAPDYFDDVTVTAIEGLEAVDIEACENIARDAGVKFRTRQLDVLG